MARLLIEMRQQTLIVGIVRSDVPRIEHHGQRFIIRLARTVDFSEFNIARDVMRTYLGQLPPAHLGLREHTTLLVERAQLAPVANVIGVQDNQLAVDLQKPHIITEFTVDLGQAMIGSGVSRLQAPQFLPHLYGGGPFAMALQRSGINLYGIGLGGGQGVGGQKVELGLGPGNFIQELSRDQMSGPIIGYGCGKTGQHGARRTILPAGIQHPLAIGGIKREGSLKKWSALVGLHNMRRLAGLTHLLDLIREHQTTEAILNVWVDRRQ